MAGPPPDPPGLGRARVARLPSVPFAGAVLCGGASTRLGTDKASVLVHGTPLALLLGRLLRAAGAVTITGVGPRPPVANALTADGMAVLDDRWPGEGPAAGVATALLHAEEALLVVVGCDYPRLQPATVVRLVEQLAADPGCAAVVAASGGRLHPTVGVWRVGVCAEPSRAFVDGGGRSLMGLVEAVGAAPVPVHEVEVLDVDTPEDLATLRAEPAPAAPDTLTGSAARRDHGSTSR